MQKEPFNIISSEIENLKKIVESCISRGDFEKALPYAEILLKTTDGKSSTYISALDTISWISLQNGQYIKAKSYISQALKAFDSKLNSDYELISLKNMLGIISMFSGKYDEALDIFEECEKIFIQNSELEHFERIFVTNNVGFCKMFLGRLNEAKEYFRESYKLAKLHENKNSTLSNINLTPFDNLGILSLLQGDLKQSEDKLNFVHNAKEYSHLSLHTSISNMIKLSYYYYYTHDYSKSIEFAKKAESLFKGKKPSFDNILLTLVLHKLYEVQKQYDLSLYYLQESLNIATNIFRDNIHNAVRFFYGKYIPWDVTNSNLDNHEYLQKAQKINIKLFGPEHAEVYRYDYLKALYYINANNIQKAQEILQNIPFENEATINAHNASLIKEMLSKNRF